MKTIEELKNYVAKKANVSTSDVLLWGDYRAAIKIPTTKEIRKIAKDFIDEYNDINDTHTGVACDVARDFYLIGKRPTGCVFEKMPKPTKKYDELRSWILTKVNPLRVKGFEIGQYDFGFRSIWEDNRWSYKLVIKLYDEELAKYRDYCYNKESIYEQINQYKAERRAEICYEDMVMGTKNL